MHASVGCFPFLQRAGLLRSPCCALCMGAALVHLPAVAGPSSSHMDLLRVPLHAKALAALFGYQDRHGKLALAPSATLNLSPELVSMLTAGPFAEALQRLIQGHPTVVVFMWDFMLASLPWSTHNSRALVPIMGCSCTADQQGWAEQGLLRLPFFGPQSSWAAMHSRAMSNGFTATFGSQVAQTTPHMLAQADNAVVKVYRNIM